MLPDGGIAECGTHAELIEQGGLYASMWDQQRETTEATEAEECLRRSREGDELGVVVRRRTLEAANEAE